MSNLIVDVRVEVPGFGVDAAFVAERGITVLSGPSGSGKSLTLAAVAGTIRPVRGYIRCGDVTFAEPARGVHLRSQDRHVGMVYQHAALFEHKSPLDNVALAVRNVGLTAARVIAAELLERVGVASLATAKTRSLSGGERQRVALARALAGRLACCYLTNRLVHWMQQPGRQCASWCVRSLTSAGLLLSW